MASQRRKPPIVRRRKKSGHTQVEEPLQNAFPRWIGMAISLVATLALALLAAALGGVNHPVLSHIGSLCRVAIPFVLMASLAGVIGLWRGPNQSCPECGCKKRQIATGRNRIDNTSGVCVVAREQKCPECGHLHWWLDSSTQGTIFDDDDARERRRDEDLARERRRWR